MEENGLNEVSSEEAIKFYNAYKGQVPSHLPYIEEEPLSLDKQAYEKAKIWVKQQSGRITRQNLKYRSGNTKYKQTSLIIAELIKEGLLYRAGNRQLISTCDGLRMPINDTDIYKYIHGLDEIQKANVNSTWIRKTFNVGSATAAKILKMLGKDDAKSVNFINVDKQKKDEFELVPVSKNKKRKPKSVRIYDNCACSPPSGFDTSKFKTYDLLACKSGKIKVEFYKGGKGLRSVSGSKKTREIPLSTALEMICGSKNYGRYKCKNYAVKTTLKSFTIDLNNEVDSGELANQT